jgi:hypothetical protein
MANKERRRGNKIPGESAAVGEECKDNKNSGELQPLTKYSKLLLNL